MGDAPADAFSEWMRRVDRAIERIEALEAGLELQTKRLTRISNGTDAPLDASVQLRRDVGTLVRAARELVQKIKPYTPHWSTDPVEAALKAFEGDYT